MTLSIQERNLVLLYHSGSREATVAQIREALPHIGEPDVNAAAVSAIAKLERMSAAAFSDLACAPEAVL